MSEQRFFRRLPRSVNGMLVSLLILGVASNPSPATDDTGGVTDPNCVCAASFAYTSGGTGSCDWTLVLENVAVGSAICTPPPSCEEIPTNFCNLTTGTVKWTHPNEWPLIQATDALLRGPCGSTASNAWRCPSNINSVRGVELNCSPGCTQE